MLAAANREEKLFIRRMISDSPGGRFEIEDFDEIPAALERLRANQDFDVILVSLAPPGDGLETLAGVRRSAPEAAIIALSAVDDEDLALRTIREGAQDCLVKQYLNARALARSMRRAIERMRIEVALAHERDLLHAMMESIPQGIYFKDLQSRFLRVSRTLAKAFRLGDPSEALGKTDLDFLAESHAGAARADEQRVIETGEPIVDKEEKATQPNGDTLWVLTTKMPFRNHRGTVIGTFGISRDVTELKVAQESLAETHERLRKSYEELKETQMQLIAAEKMSMAGRLAAGLAHEVRNPLAMIQIGVDYLDQSRKPGEDEAFDTILRAMHEGVARADAMIREIQSFAISGTVSLTPQDLNAVVRRAIEVLQPEFASRGIQVVTRFANEITRVLMDPEKIARVLSHVLTNAIHAAGPRGSVTITTRTRALGAVEVSWDAGNRSGIRFRQGEPVVVVEIDDSGPGIPRDALSKIFDPFFTTKPTGQGTGLGLTVSSKLMELHGGELRVENRPEGGARASILFSLPAAAP